jgi:acetoin utilization deacetylase AcuC-like enzyme
MQAFYSDHFVLPLPEGHRFPMQKYRMLRELLQTHLPDLVLNEPHAATDGELALAHSPVYIQRVCDGTLSKEEQQAIGFPWTAAMVERSRRSTGATIGACRAALRDGGSVNLAGGTHHAMHNRGEGFCVFNDTVVAARLMQAEQARQGVHLPVLVVDLDVHQGNGTAEITQNDDTIFTLSMHGKNNFPFAKEKSNLDIELDDGTGDEIYLDALNKGLLSIERVFSPGLVIYLAGVDAHGDDRLGKLSLSDDGFAQRDRLLFQWCEKKSLPIAMSMAGGYWRNLERMVGLQYQTINALYRYATKR